MRDSLHQDNDCHWYVVPVERTEEFLNWCEEDTESESFDPDKFSGCAVNGAASRVTFTDPKLRGV